MGGALGGERDEAPVGAGVLSQIPATGASPWVSLSFVLLRPHRQGRSRPSRYQMRAVTCWNYSPGCRVGQGRDHFVAAVLALAAAAVVAGMKGYTAITGWVADGRPVPGQELAMPQIGGHGSGPRPVLHRRIHPSGARPLARAPQPGRSRSIIWCSVTSALTGGISVTCRRSIPVTRAPPRVAPAAAAAPWLVQDHVIGMMTVRLIVAPGCPFGRPGLRPVFFRTSGMACPAVRRGRPEGVLRVLLHPGGQVSHLPPQLLHLFPQLPGLSHLHPKFRDQLIPFGDQLPQPDVRGPQPGNRLS